MVPKKILLAEDDRDDQELFYHFLHSRADILIMPVVKNGEDLLSSLQAMTSKAQLPDLIILDQNMPRRSGLQTLQLLKEDDRYKHIPVMLYSTYADEQLIQAASAMGAFNVVSKPVTAEGYLQMLDAFFAFVNKENR